MDSVFSHIHEIVSKTPDGLGWYGVEMRCRIPRSEFPDGMNVMDVLRLLVEDGYLEVRTIDGKERFFAAPAFKEIGAA